MASHEYSRHPLPAPPSQEQQYQYSSYDQSSLPQRSQVTQQYPSRQQQVKYSQPEPQQQSYPQQQSQKPERQRPRSRGFSFRSDKSHKSGEGKGHIHKISSGGLQETHEEKEHNRLATKADPTLAMNELEPSAVARAAINWDEKPPLSALQHKDASGVIITEPDRSNPTRSKWERPLDTIRSFEAAYDGGSSRQSVYRADSDSVGNWNRRSSYYGNSNGPRFPHESYYGGRSNTDLRRESAMFDPRGSAMIGGPRGDEYFDGFDGAGNGRSRYRNPRMQTDPSMYSHPAVNRGVFQSPNNHKSYETVASGSGSASYGEPSGYQTDPTSSENSSINRRSSPSKRQQEPRNDYGISFGQTPDYHSASLGPGASHPRTMPDNSHAPTPPPKSSGTLLKKTTTPAAAPQRPDMGEKRKSRLSRLFGKSS